MNSDREIDLLYLLENVEKMKKQLANIKGSIYFFLHKNLILTANHTEGIILSTCNIKANYIYQDCKLLNIFN